jgi:two-component system sensor histidine kinase/response regulator
MALGDFPGDRTGTPAASVGPEPHPPVADSTFALEDGARRLFDTLQVGVVVQGATSEVLYANARARELLGVSESEIVGRRSLDANDVAFGEDGTPILGSEHPGPQVIATRRPVRDAIMRWRRPGGGEAVWLLVNADPELAPGGEVRRVIVTFSDVTALHGVTELLRDSEGRYRQLVENAQDIIYRTDMWGFFTYVNPVATRVTGWSPDRIVGKHFLELIRADFRTRVEAHLKAQFRDRVGTSYDEFVAVTRSGDEIWIGQNVQLLTEGAKVVGFQAVARDITQRKRAEEALERERRQLRDVVAHAPVAMAILDGEGSLVAHSEQWLSLWRLAAMPLPARRHADVLPSSFGDALGRGRKSPVASTGEELVERPDGSSVYVTWAVHPWRGPAGEGTVAVAQDVDVLVRARQAAQETSRVKSEFLANVSHELRTPLSGVLGMARLLLDTSLDATQAEYAEIIRRSGRELLGVVDAILDFARAEAGRLELETGEVDAPHLVEEVCATVAAEAAAKGLHVTAMVGDAVPRRLVGDVARLRQVLLSLVGNAIKFTPSGTVVVRAGLVRGARDGTTLRFEVADTGIGLDAATQARLFQPFVQADGSATRRYGGAGLGLALCRRNVSAMGGEIGVRSEPGQGSTFWFTAHLARPDAGPLEAQAETRHGGRVLVVEDNTVNQKVAVAMIESLGYGAEAVGNGIEAVEACARQTYDAILMDCQMPQMDGFKATAFIRQREGLARHTPIIALTASVTAEDRQRCLSAGMDDYLSKPVPREALASTLRKWIPTVGTPPAVETSATPSTLSPSHPLRVLEAHAGPRALAEVIDVFLQTIPRRLDDLRQAHARGDAESIRAVTHSLKGASAQIGARGMADICVQIEAVVRGGDVSALGELLTALEADYAAVSASLREERRRVSGQVV